MICSMTGFGRAEALIGDFNVMVELRSVNSRYFEFNCRLPRGFLFLEDKLKAYLQSRISRGKVEMFVSLECKTGSDIEVLLNETYLNSYMKAVSELSKKYKIKNTVTTSDFVGNNDVFVISRSKIDEETVTDAVLEVSKVAVDNFIAMRKTEGEKLSEDVNNRIEFICNKVAFIEKKSPETVNEYKVRLNAKIKELLGEAKIDEGRLLTEVAVFADKVAVDEETVRLHSHINQLKNMLLSDEAVGRKLDFIVQEMNRETNTIGSKSQSIEIAQTVVDIKAEIEKIREQIQNIE